MIRTAVAVAAVAAAGLLSACGGGSEGDGPRTVVVDVRHSAFSEPALTVRAGETVRFVVRNHDPIAHELIIGNEVVQDLHERGTDSSHGEAPGAVSVAAGATAEMTYAFGAPGQVLFGCHLPGHWAYGMRGTVRIL